MSFAKKKHREPLNAAALYDYAVRSLGRQMRTESELRRLMGQRVEPEATGTAKIDAVVLRLKEYGFLNDTTFAETYTRLRMENEKFGQRKVRQKLAQKGVASQIVNEVVEVRYGEVSEEQLAREHLERKRIRKPENEKETARVMRRLVGAGFSVGVIYKILRQWDVPEDALLALDGLGDDESSSEE